VIFRNLFVPKAKRAVESPNFERGDIEGFWRWFKANADALAALNNEADRDLKLVDLLFDAVVRYSEGLGILVGVDENGVNELILSADGVVSKIPAVLAFLRDAPAIPGWKFTPLKQRSPGTATGFGGLKRYPEQVFYIGEVWPDGDKIDISVALPHIPDVNETDQRFLTYLLLDNLLGEYDVATAIGGIEVRMLSPGEVASGRPLTELVNEVDNLPGRARIQ